MVRYYTRYHSESTIFWIPPLVNSKDGVDVTMLFTLRESWRHGSQINPADAKSRAADFNVRQQRLNDVGRHEREKRLASFRRLWAVNIVWGFSSRLGRGFVFRAQIDISVGLRARLYSPNHLGSYPYYGDVSFQVRPRGSQS